MRLDHLLSKESKEKNEVNVLFGFEGVLKRRGRSSAGRAPALQAGGQEFKSPRLQGVRSSAGQSARLISVRSVVQVHPDPPKGSLKIAQEKKRHIRIIF